MKTLLNTFNINLILKITCLCKYLYFYFISQIIKPRQREASDVLKSMQAASAAAEAPSHVLQTP